jgi:hypothetical protein
MRQKQMLNYITNSPTPSFLPILHCVQTHPPLLKIIAGNRVYGVILFPAICRSFFLQIEDVTNVELVRQLVQAHAYWRLKGLIVDLVIWNDDHGGYRQELHDRIHGLAAPAITAD